MPKPIFFFREQAETGFLCQWYPCGFRDEDEDFNCAEQYMMWHKAKAFGDEEAQRAILAAKNPQKQKVLGQKVKGFDQNKWDEGEFPPSQPRLWGCWTDENDSQGACCRGGKLSQVLDEPAPGEEAARDGREGPGRGISV